MFPGRRKRTTIERLRRLTYWSLTAGIPVAWAGGLTGTHAVIVHSLTAAAEAGTITVEDPETATRLLLGALTRGAMLIANSPDPIETRHAVAKSMRALLSSFTPSR